MAEIIWSATAIEDINAIATYIGRDSVRNATLQVEMILEKSKILESFPLAGKQVPELESFSYREILAGRYRLKLFPTVRYRY